MKPSPRGHPSGQEASGQEASGQEAFGQEASGQEAYASSLISANQSHCHTTNTISLEKHVFLFVMLYNTLNTIESLKVDVIALNISDADKRDPLIFTYHRKQHENAQVIVKFLSRMKSSFIQHYEHFSKFENDILRMERLYDVIELNVHVLFGNERCQFDRLVEYQELASLLYEGICTMDIPELECEDIKKIYKWIDSLEE